MTAPNDHPDCIDERQPTLVESYITARREARCPACHDVVVVANGDRCRSCDADLQLCVGSDDLRLAPWLTATILAAGLAGLGGSMCLVMIILGGSGPRKSAFLLWFFAILMLATIAAGALLRWRRRVLRSSIHTQWTIAGICIAAAAVLLAGTVVFITMMQ